MFGWSAEDCLEMPATRFFALLNAGRKLESSRLNAILFDLCDVAAIPMADAKYYSATKSHFRDRLLALSHPAVTARTPKPRIQNEQEEKDAVFSIFRAAKRFV